MKYDKLPEHMQDAAREWAEHGLPHPDMLGSFMRAVLTNDLMGAFASADDVNGKRMRDWAMWLYNDAPSLCHGTEGRMLAWHERGGLNGRAKVSA